MWGFLFKWSAIIVFLGGTYFAVARYFEKKGAAPYVAALAVDDASITRLEAGISAQNEAVSKLTAESNARQKAGQDALRAAVAREKATRVTVDRLRASGAVVRALGDPCVISKTLSEAMGL